MKKTREALQAAATGAKQTKRLLRTRLSHVSMEGTKWLLKDRIPLGGVTIVAGEPGAGKTAILIELISRSSVGGQWPNDEGKAPEGFWFYVTTENDTARTIKPRLMVAGGDPDAVEVIKGTELKGKTLEQRGVDLAQDIVELEEVIRHGSTDLDCIGVVFDPLDEYLGEKVDSWKGSDVRRVLGPLAALAEKYQIAVIGILHPRKAETQTLMNKVSGAKAFMAQARCVSFCLLDNDHEDGEDAAERSVFIPIKNNLGRRPKGLLYMMEEETPRPGKGDDPALVAEVGMVPKICWLGVTDKTAEELSAPSTDKGDKADKVADAMALMMQQLASGPKEAAHLDRVRDDAGIGDSTWRQARKKLERLGVIANEGSGRDIKWRMSDGKTTF